MGATFLRQNKLWWNRCVSLLQAIFFFHVWTHDTLCTRLSACRTTPWAWNNRNVVTKTTPLPFFPSFFKFKTQTSCRLLISTSPPLPPQRPSRMPQPPLSSFSHSSTHRLIFAPHFRCTLLVSRGTQSPQNPVLQMEMSHRKSALNKLLISFLWIPSLHSKNSQSMAKETSTHVTTQTGINTDNVAIPLCK